MSGADIVEKLDELLKDDKNFDTRAGLRFMTELVRDAFNYIEAQKRNDKERTDIQSSMLTRISHVENGLKEFLELRKHEQEKAEAERQKWRWAIIGPMVVILLNQISDWVKAIIDLVRP